MKRVKTVALRVLTLFCVGALLRRQYIIYHSQFSIDTQGHGIYAVLNNATAEYPVGVLPPPTNRVVKNVTSDDDQLDVQIATTSVAVATATLSKLTPAAGSTLPTELSVIHSDADTLPGNKDGDPELLRETLRYVQGHQGPPLTRPSRASLVQPPPTIDTTISSLLRRPPQYRNSSSP
jgi:hypothetical protein